MSQWVKAKQEKQKLENSRMHEKPNKIAYIYNPRSLTWKQECKAGECAEISRVCQGEVPGTVAETTRKFLSQQGERQELTLKPEHPMHKTSCISLPLPPSQLKLMF